VHLKAFEREWIREGGPETGHASIELVMKSLRKSGSLSTVRPHSDPSSKPLPSEYERFRKVHGRYVYEDMMARKVHIPSAREATTKLPNMAVWISDPEPALAVHDAPLAEHDWDVLRGAFLYLVEVYPDVQEPLPQFPFMSGVSALQMVVNRAFGQDLLAPPRVGQSDEAESWEPFGRGHAGGSHPLQKLAWLGAQISDARHIASLYRVRYQSEEQTIDVGGRSYRTHDIVGYPLFVAAL
jgi:hypothetical protein